MDIDRNIVDYICVNNKKKFLYNPLTAFEEIWQLSPMSLPPKSVDTNCDIVLKGEIDNNGKKVFLSLLDLFFLFSFYKI